MFSCFQITPRRNTSQSNLRKSKIAPAPVTANVVPPPTTKPLYNVRNSRDSTRFKIANNRKSRSGGSSGGGPLQSGQRSSGRKKPLQRLPRNRNSNNNQAGSTRSAQNLYSQFANELTPEAFPRRVKSCGAQPKDTGMPTPLTIRQRSSPKYQLPKRNYTLASNTPNSIPTPSSLIQNISTKTTTPQIVRKSDSITHRWSTSRRKSHNNTQTQLVSLPKKSNSKVAVSQTTQHKRPLNISRPDTSPKLVSDMLNNKFEPLSVSGTNRSSKRNSLQELQRLDTASPTLGFTSRRYQRLERAVQNKLIERLGTANIPIENLQTNRSEDDSMRSVIQDVIQKHISEQTGNGDKPVQSVSKKSRVMVSRQGPRRQSLNTLMIQQAGITAQGQDKNSKNDNIYSAYTQKLLQEDTPRTQNCANESVTEPENNNSKTIYNTQNYRIIQKSDGTYAYKLPNKPCEELPSYKNRDAKDIAKYVKKLKKRLSTAAAKGSVMSLSKHDSDFKLGSTPRQLETRKMSIPKNCFDSKIEDLAMNTDRNRPQNYNNQSKNPTATKTKLNQSKTSNHKSHKTNTTNLENQAKIKTTTPTPAEITQKIRNEINATTKTSAQLNYLLNKTAKWVMTQDFLLHAQDDAQKIN